MSSITKSDEQELMDLYGVDQEILSIYKTEPRSWKFIHECWERFRNKELPLNHTLQHSTWKGVLCASIAYGTIDDTVKELARAIRWLNSIEQ